MKGTMLALMIGLLSAAPAAAGEDGMDLLFELSDAIDAKEAASGYDRLAPHEQVFQCVWQLEAEVNNGGFHQYYWNSAGDHARETPAALRAIGAQKTAAIVEKANAIFGEGGPSAKHAGRQEALDRMPGDGESSFETLDQAFLAYEEDLGALLLAYIKAQAKPQPPAPPAESKQEPGSNASRT